MNIMSNMNIHVDCKYQMSAGIIHASAYHDGYGFNFIEVYRWIFCPCAHSQNYSNNAELFLIMNSSEYFE